MTHTVASPHARSVRRTAPLYAVAALVWIASVAPVIRSVADLPRAGFTIRNHTRWDLTVDVRGPDGTLTVATVDAGTTRAVRDVIIPGPTWEFGWRFGSDELAVTTVPNQQLRQAGFQLVAPEVVEEKLATAGVPASP